MKKSTGQVLVVLVTVATRKEAMKIAVSVVEARLAACANILPTIQSIYRWKGKLVKDKEVLILLKSTKPRYPALEKAIKAIHSYETPEIIALPVRIGSSQYIEWIDGATHH